MNKVQIQIQISADAMHELKAAAEKKGVTPGILARLILNERFGRADAESKTYTFTTRSWREIEAYVKVRNLGSVEGFSPIALDMAVSRGKLSPRQKAEFEKILGL
jgi:hypothetical protein